ncbi:protein of unknown function DUF4405 [Pelosinus sp. UFO1]|nr:protein of unknown function DUF4405 [Pelosinus sp. UFO1]
MASEANVLIRNLLNLAMAVLILMVVDYRFIGNTVHEILGLSAALLIIVHNVVNRRWYLTLFKGKMNLRRLLNTVVNLLLFATMMLLIVMAVLISQTIFAAVSLNGDIVAHQLHMMAGYWFFILVSIHLGLHWEMLVGKMYRWLEISCTSRDIMVSRIFSIFIIGYGSYVSFSRHIGSKLLVQHTFSNWATAPSMSSFVFDYLAIMGCYIGVTYYLMKLLKV